MTQQNEKAPKTPRQLYSEPPQPDPTPYTLVGFTRELLNARTLDRIEQLCARYAKQFESQTVLALDLVAKSVREQLRSLDAIEKLIAGEEQPSTNQPEYVRAGATPDESNRQRFEVWSVKTPDLAEKFRAWMDALHPQDAIRFRRVYRLVQAAMMEARRRQDSERPPSGAQPPASSPAPATYVTHIRDTNGLGLCGNEIRQGFVELAHARGDHSWSAVVTCEGCRILFERQQAEPLNHYDALSEEYRGQRLARRMAGELASALIAADYWGKPPEERRPVSPVVAVLLERWQNIERGECQACGRKGGPIAAEIDADGTPRRMVCVWECSPFRAPTNAPKQPPIGKVSEEIMTCIALDEPPLQSRAFEGSPKVRNLTDDERKELRALLDYLHAPAAAGEDPDYDVRASARLRRARELHPTAMQLIGAVS